MQAWFKKGWDNLPSSAPKPRRLWTRLLKKAEITLPISPEAERRYAEIWARFIEPGDQP